jgi:glycosyltransferase involved in cell wall biosynthesis
MNDDPRVSVVMSVYNGLPYLSEAVESILDQTFTDFEFIIIDDGSTDDTTAVLQRYADRDSRIRFIEQENRGHAPSLNRGIEAAKGEYIARMDSDDISLPRRFQLQVEHLDANPECVLVGGEAQAIDSDGNTLDGMSQQPRRANANKADIQYDHDNIDKALLGGKWAFIHPSVMMRKEKVYEIGGYKERFDPAEDLDLFIRLSEAGKVQNIPQTILKYRCHSGQLSRTSSSQRYLINLVRRKAHIRRNIPLPEDLRAPAMARSYVAMLFRKANLLK